MGQKKWEGVAVWCLLRENRTNKKADEERR